MVFLDDIVLLSKSTEDHIKKVRHVPRLQSKAGVTVKLNRHKLLTETTYYLDRVIRPGRVELSEYTTEAVAKLEYPASQTELHLFLGQYNVFTRFVLSPARLAALLNK